MCSFLASGRYHLDPKTTEESRDVILCWHSSSHALDISILPFGQMYSARPEDAARDIRDDCMGAGGTSLSSSNAFESRELQRGLPASDTACCTYDMAAARTFHNGSRNVGFQAAGMPTGAASSGIPCIASPL